MVESISRRDCPANGVWPRELEGKRWRRVSHGQYVRSETPDGLAARAAAVLPVFPSGAAYSHLTAAQLFGIWLPGPPPWLPLIATLPPRAQRPERKGLYVARSRAGLPTAWDLDGVPVLPPELVVGQLAEDLEVVDLVAAIDSALHLRLCTEEQILAGRRSRQRGLPRLRQALAVCDGRSESAWETFLRLLHVVSGIEVEPQASIHDEQGAIVARADLRIRGTRRLPEYDGADHRDREQHQRDLGREKTLSRLAFERYGYIAREIVRTPHQIIRDAEDALGLRHDPDRLNAWLQLVERSSLHSRGRYLLRRRLRRFAKPLRGRVRPSSSPAIAGSSGF